MKKGKIFTNCLMSIWAMCILVIFNSCAANSDELSDLQNEIATTETPFTFILKAYSENEDITAKGDAGSTTLYIFDENNDFYKQMVVDETYPLQVKPVEIDCPESNKITVIAWSGLSFENEEISLMNKASIISDLQINLKQNNGIVSNFPGDLFHGQITLSRNQTKASAQTLKMSRKVSALTLTTKGILKVYDSKEGSFYYKIKKTKSSFNYNGNLTGSDVEYIIPASLNEKGNLVTEPTPILPASDITIELYKDDKIILSSKNLQNDRKVSINEGEQICASFDLPKKSCDILVSSWGVIIQHATVD